MSKIYDCFNFFNELDILDLRLDILNEYVDYFVIVESNKTFTSKDKKFNFEQNKKRYKKYLDKIIYVKVTDTPSDFNNIILSDTVCDIDIINNKIFKYVNESTGWSRNQIQWGVEIYQRECILRGLIDCNDQDIIIISDLDEIPNPNIFDNLKQESKDNFIELKQKMYCYQFDLFKEYNWSGSKICEYKNLKNISLNHLRQNKYTNKVIDDGGWHFSFFGGVDTIIEKIESYSHQEFNNSHYKNNIAKNIESETDPFFRGKLIKVDISREYPEQILKKIMEHYYK
jgi:beta-1,4-mannosyl-glycoprotein beta-1,4-N-acetylglucosaminyltransferase